MKKKTGGIMLSIVILITFIAFAGSIYHNKELDRKEIGNITNSFFSNKEEAFLSDSDYSMTEYYCTNDVKSIKNYSSFKLFEYEKQIRNDNALDISNEKFEYTINVITIDDDKATVKCYEYYEYTFKNDPERSSRGTEYQITFAKKNNEWGIVDVTTDNELERLFADNDV